MALNYDAIDITYGWNGDYLLNSDNDLEDTSSDQIQSLVQEVQTVVNSALNDWEETPHYAANLDDFVGEPNNSITAKSITQRIHTALVSNQLVAADDLGIRVVPISNHEVLVLVSISALPTENNSIIENTNLVVSFTFNYFERGITFIENTGE